MRASQKQRIELLRVRVEEGADARVDLVTELADIAALRATIPPLRAQLADSGNRLALLVGQAPAEAAIPRLELADLRLPEAVPINLPLRLVRTRPDILASEAVLALTSAEIGVAEADLYPTLTIDAGLGLAGGGSGLSLPSPEGAFDLGAGLLAPLFDGGRLRAQRDVPVATTRKPWRASRAGADRIRGGRRYPRAGERRRALAEQRIALEAGEESLELALFRSEEGAISVTDVLAVQQIYEQARFSYIEAVATRLQGTAAHFAALGPGPLDEGQVAGITAREYLDFTRAELERGRVPEEGL